MNNNHRYKYVQLIKCVFVTNIIMKNRIQINIQIQEYINRLAAENNFLLTRIWGICT